MGEIEEKAEASTGEEFTHEEKVILGQVEEEVKADPESGGEAGDQGEAAVESETEGKDGDGAVPDGDERVPLDRFKKVDGARKTVEEKLDLLKRDPDAYYQLYPDERPAPKHQAAQPKAAVPAGDLASVKVDGGPFHGKTLAEVEAINSDEADRMLNDLYAQNPALATKLQYQLLDSRKEITVRQKTAHEKLVEDSRKEIDHLAQSVSVEMFGKAEGLEQVQNEAVKSEIAKTLKWMQETGRGGGNLADAYWLMNRDKELTKAASQGAEAVAKKMSRAADSVHISGGPSGGQKTGYESFESMSTPQVAAALGKMSDSRYREFVKGAPQGLKDKHPGLPW